MRRILVISLVAAALSASLLSAQSRPFIQGAWRLVEITISGPNTSINSKPQPALYLFTARHYSIIRVTSANARPQFKDPTKVTEAEALAIWGPLQAQSGTYEITGENLNLLPTVAKNPQRMRAGMKADVFTFALQGENLTLVQKFAGDGQPTANLMTVKLTRAE